MSIKHVMKSLIENDMKNPEDEDASCGERIVARAVQMIETCMLQNKEVLNCIEEATLEKYMECMPVRMMMCFIRYLNSIIKTLT